MAVGNALLDMYEEIQRELQGDDYISDQEKKQLADTATVNPCPQCGNELVFEGGCNICKACGWTKCD